MKLQVNEESAAALRDYAAVPIAFSVDRVFEIDEGLSERFLLVERALESSYIKDYDALESPLNWLTRFNAENWIFFAARADGRRVGGVALALNTPPLTLNESGDDLAVVWDIRVSPSMRGGGVGTALLRAAEVHAFEKRYRQVMVETQNINVPACRFYARHGYLLRAVDPNAYPTLKREIQMSWYKELRSQQDG